MDGEGDEVVRKMKMKREIEMDMYRRWRGKLEMGRERNNGVEMRVDMVWANKGERVYRARCIDIYKGRGRVGCGEGEWR